MKENKQEKLVWIIFTFVGAMFFIIGFIIFGNIFDYENKVDTTGIITEIIPNIKK